MAKLRLFPKKSALKFGKQHRRGLILKDLFRIPGIVLLPRRSKIFVEKIGMKR